jgi:lipopolysaccharide transport system ATP-binding protein
MWCEMGSDSIAIRVSNLGKKYTIGGPQEKYLTFRDALVNSVKVPFRRFSSHEPPQEFWALKEVSFDVEQGEVVGIIGRNGAGKSTLLKILSRITSPTEGTVDLYGRVGSLLEVGTGFHPELTGRENIFLSGSILGMKHSEIDAKLDEIVKFSEIEKFLDTPVKRYSSGMYVRLAFAVAAHMDTEILVIDEVLAVGDTMFQKKCLGKMDQVSKSEGKTVLFVSHNMPMISSLCATGVLLDKGIVRSYGAIGQVVNSYLNSNLYGNGEIVFNDRKPGDAEAILHKVKIVNTAGSPITEIEINKPFFIEMEYEVFKENMRLTPNLHFRNDNGQYIFSTTDAGMDIDAIKKTKKGRYISRCEIPGNFLNSGTYYIGVALTKILPQHVHFDEKDLIFITINDPISGVPTRSAGYAGPIPGLLRPLLKWELR